MTAAADIAYPSLAFIFGGRSVTIGYDEGFLSDAPPSQFRAGFFQVPFLIVDSQLVRWRVEEVEAKPNGGLGRIADFVRNKPVPLQVKIRRDGTVSVEELKTMVARALRDDPTGIWTGREESPEEIVDQVQRASTFGEVLEPLDWPGRPDH